MLVKNTVITCIIFTVLLISYSDAIAVWAIVTDLLNTSS